MRPLVTVLALCALLFLCACQVGPGPSSVLDLQPGVGGGARVFADPEGGVGVAVRVDLGKYGFRTGEATDSAPVIAPTTAAEPCASGACPVPMPDAVRTPRGPDAGSPP